MQFLATNLKDLLGIQTREKVYCTLDIEKRHYILMLDWDDKICICGLRKSPWYGTEFFYISASESVIEKCEKLISLAKENPQAYPMGGTHYVYKHREDGTCEFCRAGKSAWLRPEAREGSPLLKSFVSMAVSALFSWVMLAYYDLAEVVQMLLPAGMKVSVLTQILCVVIVSNLIFLLQKSRNILDTVLIPSILLGIVPVVEVVRWHSGLRWIPIGIMVATVLYCVFSVIYTKVKKGKLPSFHRTQKWIERKLIFSLELCIFSAIAVITTVGFNTPIASPQTPTTALSEAVEQAYEQAIEYLPQAQWEQLTSEKKIAVLQAIHNYEAAKAGCSPCVVKVGDKLKETTLGECNPSEKVIYINPEHLEKSSSFDILITILHETRHRYQYVMAGMYAQVKSALDEEYRNLPCFREAYAYMKNYNAYIEPQTDAYGYWDQVLEEDARDWAFITLIKQYSDVIGMTANK